MIQNSKILSCLLLGAAILIFNSCATLEQMAGDVLKKADKPTVKFKNLTVNELKSDQAILGLELDVSNPYPVPLFADSMDFEFLSGANQILSGQTTENFNIPAKSIAPLKLNLGMPYKSALEALNQVKPGSVFPLTTNLKFDLTGKDILPANFDVSKSTDVPIPAPPEVKVSSIKWEELSLSNAKANMALDILNTNSFPFDMNTLDYGLKLGGIDVSTAKISNATSFKPGEASTLSLDFDLQPSKLGLAAFNMLRSNDLNYEFVGDIDASTPFGPIQWDVDRTGETKLLK